MKNYFLIMCLVSLFGACNEPQHTENKIETQPTNALLAQKVKVADNVDLINTDNPEWVKNINNEELGSFIISTVLDKNFKLTENRRLNFTNEEIKMRMGVAYDTIFKLNKKTNKFDTVVSKTKIKYSEIERIYFKEEWDFNKSTLKLEKQVKMWGPVRVFYRKDDINKKDQRQSIVYRIDNSKDTICGTILVKDFIYTFEFKSEYLERTGLDKHAFLTFLIQQIKEGKQKAYDPIWLVDKSKRKFTFDDIKEYSGMNFENPNYDFSRYIKKIIFIEDWYFNKKTFNFFKKVKGIGLVANLYGENGREDKILFFTFFE